MNLAHEFKHNYQSIFCLYKYKNDSKNYFSTKWENKWIEQDATKYAKRFLLDNMKIINHILDIKTDWYIVAFTDKKVDKPIISQ